MNAVETMSFDHLLTDSENGCMSDPRAIESRMRRLARIPMIEYMLGFEADATRMFDSLRIPLRDRDEISLGCMALFLSAAFSLSSESELTEDAMRLFGEPLVHIGRMRRKISDEDARRLSFKRIDVRETELIPGIESSPYGLLQEVLMTFDEPAHAQKPIEAVPLSELIERAVFEDCPSSPKCDFGNRRISAAFNIDAHCFINMVERVCGSENMLDRYCEIIRPDGDLIDLVHDLLDDKPDFELLIELVDECNGDSKHSISSEEICISPNPKRIDNPVGLFHDLFVAPLALFWRQATGEV